MPLVEPIQLLCLVGFCGRHVRQDDKGVRSAHAPFTSIRVTSNISIVLASCCTSQVFHVSINSPCGRTSFLCLVVPCLRRGKKEQSLSSKNFPRTRWRPLRLGSLVGDRPDRVSCQSPPCRPQGPLPHSAPKQLMDPQTTLQKRSYTPTWMRNCWKKPRKGKGKGRAGLSV